MNFLLNILPSLAGIVLGICYLPQIIHTAKTKNVEGMSLGFWSILNVAILMLLINSIVIYQQFGTWGYMLTELFNFLLSFVMLVLVLRYKRKNRKKVNN